MNIDSKNHRHLSDTDLLHLCQKYGKEALLWRRKFIGLLPEVNRRKLYKKKGCFSIFEFAAKLAGISQEQVRRVLSLEKRFEKVPALQKLLVEGEVSVNKLVRLASIVTVQNQEALAIQARLLPKTALETLVRDEKKAREVGGENGVLKNNNDLNKPLFEHESVPGHKYPQLSPEVARRLMELEQKGIDINGLLTEFLDQREWEIEEEKEEIAREMEVEGRVANPKSALKSAPRYIPIKIKKLLAKEHGTKCSLQHCQKPSEQLHHTQRFSLARTHDPRFLAPLCKEHHTIAHSIDLKFHERREKVVGG